MANILSYPGATITDTIVNVIGTTTVISCRAHFYFCAHVHITLTATYRDSKSLDFPLHIPNRIDSLLIFQLRIRRKPVPPNGQFRLCTLRPIPILGIFFCLYLLIIFRFVIGNWKSVILKQSAAINAKPYNGRLTPCHHRRRHAILNLL